MLRRVTTSLLRWEQHGLLGAASQYSSQAADYTLVLKTAAEVGTPAKPMPDKEVGYAAGVPLETFQRKVCWAAAFCMFSGARVIIMTYLATARE